VVIVVMGVSGSGKTTVGLQLAQQLRWLFADADDYHSSGNVEKMRNGIALTDAYRAQWLHALRSLIAGWISTQTNAVLACSALKQTYREYLRAGKQVRFVYLKASEELLSQRLLERQGHYMKRQMLESQLSTLEEPNEEEPNEAIVVNASGTPENIVREIRRDLGLV
jgi:gluconokinase